MPTVCEQPGRRTGRPAHHGRLVQPAIDAGARTVIARQGIPVTDSMAMLRRWALRCHGEADSRARTVTRQTKIFYRAIYSKEVR